MKRYIGILVGLVAIVAAAGAVASQFQRRAKEAEREAGLQRIRADYLERAGWLRANPDERSYREEVNPFFRAYFADLEDWHRRHGVTPDYDAYLDEAERKEGRSGGASGRVDRKAFYESVRRVFDAMREGKYNPVHTATDRGMRLDVLSSDVKMAGGSPKVRYQLVLWGASRELRDEGKTKKMITSASWDVSWKLFDQKGKLLGKMDASGDPSMKVDWPERFIAEFPPQMLLGHYDMDLVPAEVSQMEITFNVSSRSRTGGEARAVFPWKLETPAEWKLRPGETWEGATEGTAPEEEINPAARK